MTSLFAERALLPQGWANRVRVMIDETGHLASVSPDSTAKPGDERLGSKVLLPAPGNLHSHAFQRAMAGMTEYRSASHDDFWSWRSLMYRFLDVLTPDEIEAIAALVYVEMQEAGYAAVGEFHYVHHQPGGAAYDNIAELSERIFAAAGETGIGLTHLPVLYTYGGADRQPLQGGQLRFGCDIDRFQSLHQAASTGLKRLNNDSLIGVAPHSMRATYPEQLFELSDHFGSGPIHIHVAEQRREVQEINAWLGARPVAWLLDNLDINARWCLVHATQMQAAETVGLARSGAVAGLCPITEANLGDGIFPGQSYGQHGGRYGVGSDSNVRISVSEELRQLEYSQRLKHRARNVLAQDEVATGETLYRQAAIGGAQALGRNSGTLEEGRLADLVAIETDHVVLCGLTTRQLLDGWIFAADDTVVTDLWSAGRHCVRDGRHRLRDSVERRFRTALRRLIDRI
jgi:formimidoylglutamate deiminase